VLLLKTWWQQIGNIASSIGENNMIKNINEVTIEGVLELTHFGGISKSAHDVIVIKTETEKYILRLIGDNPFEVNEEMKKVLGKTVRLTGLISGNVLTARKGSVVKE